MSNGGRRARSPARSVAAAARVAAMSRLSLTVIALAALAAAAADAPRPRLIDFNPWAWLPANRNQSPSIMDYFFPPSRTPKQATNFPADRTPIVTESTPAPTTLEERSTTYGKKISTKTKTTVPATNPTASMPPKTKKSTRKPTTTQEPKITQTKTETTIDATATTYRPTKKYTIRPVVRTTETLTVQDTEMTMSADSTETVSVDTAGTTLDEPKETAPTLSTADDTHATDAGTVSTATVESSTQTDSTEPADSREGYIPLRDKPQQTHVKINDQTKKEVSDLTPQLELCFFFLFKIIHSLIVTTFLFSHSVRKFLIVSK